MHSFIDSGFAETLQHGSCPRTQVKETDKHYNTFSSVESAVMGVSGERRRILDPLYPHLQCGYASDTCPRQNTLGWKSGSLHTDCRWSKQSHNPLCPQVV